jgi:hypothetical protein
MKSRNRRLIQIIVTTKQEWKKVIITSKCSMTTHQLKYLMLIFTLLQILQIKKVRFNSLENNLSKRTK